MKSILVTLAIALFALCAFADDGVTLINQNMVAKGPYTTTAPGSYQLSSNLDVRNLPNSDCIDITTNNVTIDLNGFTIFGASTGENFGIKAADTDYKN